MIRKIINIDEKKCNGCGICITACHEGAIQLINGKAKLIKDQYCDGLGDCLPECPTNAISMIEREADEYNEELVKIRMEEHKNKGLNISNEKKPSPCGCPGTMAKNIDRKNADNKLIASFQSGNLSGLTIDKKENVKNTACDMLSELRQWPIQLKLINTKAPYLENADLLIAADCTAYAYANFHRDFIKDRITIIGCPKLDDNEYYKEKLAEILANNNIKSIKVVRMSVPCCGGIIQAVKTAMLTAEVIVPYSEVIINTDGSIASTK